MRWIPTSNLAHTVQRTLQSLAGTHGMNGARRSSSSCQEQDNSALTQAIPPQRRQVKAGKTPAPKIPRTGVSSSARYA